MVVKMKDYIEDAIVIIGVALMIIGIICVPFFGAKLLIDYNCNQIGKLHNLESKAILLSGCYLNYQGQWIKGNIYEIDQSLKSISMSNRRN